MTNTVYYPALGGTWLNADGLTVRFGSAAAVNQMVGKPTNYGLDQEYDLTLRADELFQTTFTDETFGQIEAGYPTTPFVAGTIIKSVEITPTTAFTSATSAARLNVGLVQATGQPGSSGDDGALVEGYDLIGASLNVPVLVTTGDFYQTALADGTSGPKGLYIWLSVSGGEAFTAGEARIRIIVIPPPKPDPAFSGANTET